MSFCRIFFEERVVKLDIYSYMSTLLTFVYFNDKIHIFFPHLKFCSTISEIFSILNKEYIK